MWRKYNQRTSRLEEYMFETAITIAIVFSILLLTFWVLVVLIWALLIYLIHCLNLERSWYSKHDWLKITLSYTIAIVVLIVWWIQIQHNWWNIKNSLSEWTWEISNYATVKMLKWRLRMELDPTWKVIETIHETSSISWNNN